MRGTDETEKMADMHPIVKKRGMFHYPSYRVPWGVRIVLDESQQPRKFETYLEAFTSATYAMIYEFRNKTEGWNENNPSVKDEAEALFKKGPKKNGKT